MLLQSVHLLSSQGICHLSAASRTAGVFKMDGFSKAVEICRWSERKVSKESVKTGCNII